MNRAAQLAKVADRLVQLEQYQHTDTARRITRAALYQYAKSLGFPENEISAAIDTALGGR